MSTPAYDVLLAECRRPEGPAVIRAEAVSAEEASRLAAALTADKIQGRVIDGARLQDKADLLRDVAAAFAFPSYFGHNWDALIDCWSDMHWLPGRGHVLVLLHGDAFAAADAPAHDTLLDIAQFVADRWHSQDEHFVFKVVRAAS
jgi:hypothetical protein